MLLAARAMTMTGYDILSDAQLRQAVRAAFDSADPD